MTTTMILFNGNRVPGSGVTDTTRLGCMVLLGTDLTICGQFPALYSLSVASFSAIPTTLGTMPVATWADPSVKLTQPPTANAATTVAAV